MRASANWAAYKLAEFERQEYLFRYVFPWAIEKAKQRYVVVATGRVSHCEQDQNQKDLSGIR